MTTTLTSVNTTQTASTIADQQSQNEYIDLTVRGIGYLQRARTVTGKGKKAKSMLCVCINALRGSKDDVSYTYFDCIVVGAKAIELVTQFMDKVNPISCDDGKTKHGHKVLVNFSLGDPRVDKYEKDGENRFSLKARLLNISRMTIDGTVVYDGALEKAQEALELAKTGT